MRRSFVVSFAAALALALSLVVVPVAAQVVTPYIARTWISTAPSGVNGFACKNTGCRVDFGPGPTDYLYAVSLGTIASATNFSASGSVRASTALGISTGGALPTCTIAYEGDIYRMSGTGGTGTTFQTRFCVCVSDGAASPTYSWRNLISGTAGTATVCNP